MGLKKSGVIVANVNQEAVASSGKDSVGGTGLARGAGAKSAGRKAVAAPRRTAHRAPGAADPGFAHNYQGHETFMPYVLNRTTGAVNADFQVVLRNHGMTLLHWRVLAFLRETDGLGISALANAAGVDQATLSRALTVMETAGYISRQPSATDQRVLEIHLLPAGKKQFNKVLPPAWAIFERAVNGLTDKEQQELQRLLKKVWGNFA